jgi:F0F1-type ATP synthase epsilon subunit
MCDKHTPGPWLVYHTAGGHLGVHGPNKVSICSISILRDTTWEEKEANARLVAAAPDLLETAQRAAEAQDMSRTELAKLAAEARIVLKQAVEPV